MPKKAVVVQLEKRQFTQVKLPVQARACTYNFFKNLCTIVPLTQQEEKTL